MRLELISNGRLPTIVFGHQEYSYDMKSVKNWVKKHPNLTAWFVLALGMVILLVFEARDVGLVTSQWFWLIVVTILVAGAAIWIISWGDDDDSGITEDENQAESTQ